MINESKGPITKGMSKVADLMMTGSGVRKMNRLGVENFMNAQVKEMRVLSREALGNSEYAEGLTKNQVDDLFNALKRDNIRDRAIREAVFYKTLRYQPIGRTAMPPAYLKMKNGRILYSMRMYMTKMASRMHKDVFKKAYDAERAGLNTPEGRKLMREAIMNTGRYSSLILALNAVVDPGRKEFFRGKESERDFASQMGRQAMSFASGGLLDPDMQQYGMSAADTLVPPAIAAGGSVIDIAMKALNNDEVSETDLKRAAMFIPGYRQALWLDEAMGELN